MAEVVFVGGPLEGSGAFLTAGERDLLPHSPEHVLYEALRREEVIPHEMTRADFHAVYMVSRWSFQPFDGARVRDAETATDASL